VAETAGPRSGVAPDETCHNITTWSRGHVEFLRSSLGAQRSATLILAAAVVFSLVWANVAGADYHAFWTARVDISIDGHGVGLSTREVVNQGLMSFFFLVVGLEARREWDLGDLRDRRRALLPLRSASPG
jgi:Na+/H+ antiporter NhaA